MKKKAAAANPYRWLCIEVLGMAMSDASSCPDRRKREKRRYERDEALAWVFGDRSGRLSFQTVCAGAGVSPLMVRRTLFDRLAPDVQARVRLLYRYGIEPGTTHKAPVTGATVPSRIKQAA